MIFIGRQALGIGKCDLKVFETKAYAEGWNSAISIIESAPSADVAPTIHAHWKREDRKYVLNKFRCSNCRCASPIDTQQFLTDYCGNCGAKMDGKDGE